MDRLRASDTERLIHICRLFLVLVCLVQLMGMLVGHLCMRMIMGGGVVCIRTLKKSKACGVVAHKRLHEVLTRCCEKEEDGEE